MKEATIENALCPVTVGRDGEIARLLDALEGARRGQGRLVILAGDAGLGKTRLARELCTAASAQGMTVMWGSCSEADLSLPYLPFLEAIGNHLATADAARLQEQLGPARRELARLFPQLDPEAGPDDPSDPLQGRVRLFESVLSLLGMLDPERGVMLVVDDLHWADASTRELLEYLARRVRSHRILVLATCRTDELERTHPLARIIERWERSGVDSLRLRPLPPDRVGEMLQAIFGLQTLRVDVRDFLHIRSEGNPYALEEILKEAIDRGDITRTETGWRQPSPAHLRLPKTVRDTVLRRLERLPRESAGVLRSASVLGRSFEYRTLVGVSGCDEEVVQRALGSCVEQQLLEEDPQLSTHYRFRHALTRDAVYEDLLAPQRESLHGRAAQVLAADPATPPIDLCHHLLAARRGEQAVPLAMSAGRQAMQAHAYRDAAGFFERILPFLAGSAQRGEVLCQLGTALLLAGDAARAETHLRDGITLKQAEGARDAASYRLWLGRCHWERARPDLARAEYERARLDLEGEGEGEGVASEELALTYVRLASVAVFDLDGERACELAQQAIQIAERSGSEAPRIWAYNYLGLGLVQQRRVDEGLEWLDRSYLEAAALDLNVIAANALYNGIQVRIQHLRPRQALDKLRLLQSMQAGSMASLQALRAEAQLHLWGLGNPGLALRALEEALAVAREGEAEYWETWLRPHMAVALGQLDRLDSARQLLGSSGAQGQRQDQVVEAWAAMRINLDSGRLEPAAAQALQTLEPGSWPLRVRLFLSDLAVEVLVAAGLLVDAGRLHQLLLDQAPDSGHPWLLRIEGRLAAAAQQWSPAAELLTRAAEAFEAVGARHEEAATRLALAEVLGRAGAEPQAKAQLRTVLAGARERGAAFQQRIARTRLWELGATGISPEHVKMALENLYQPALLSRSPLAEPSGGSEVEVGESLQKLLTRVIEEVAASAQPRDAEAGQLLRDYYVKRVGSQEVVAERLYLTRATFYRRLHRGWEAVAERLAAFEA